MNRRVGGHLVDPLEHQNHRVCYWLRVRSAPLRYGSASLSCSGAARIEPRRALSDRRAKAAAASRLRRDGGSSGDHRRDGQLRVLQPADPGALRPARGRRVVSARVIRERAVGDFRASRGRWPVLILAPVLSLVLLVSVILFSAGTLGLRLRWPAAAVSVARAAIPFRSIGNYGLFAAQFDLAARDPRRGERRWRLLAGLRVSLEARRPDSQAPVRRPAPAAAGLADVVRGARDLRAKPWFIAFLDRLLEGSPSVERLLLRNPFPSHPPRYIRAVPLIPTVSPTPPRDGRPAPGGAARPAGRTARLVGLSIED